MRIKNWDTYQHYKDRKPPWIKLYRDILDDPEWHELSGDDAKSLVMLWLIASESTDGSIPNIKTLSFRLRIKETQVNQLLARLSHWLVQDASIVLADSKHDAIPETERETYTETETKKKEGRFAPPSLSDVTAYIHARGSPINPESFVDFYTSNGWKVGKNVMKDWQACVRTWEKRNETNRPNTGAGQNGRDNRSRAQRVSDKLDEIARADIEQNGFADALGKRPIQKVSG